MLEEGNFGGRLSISKMTVGMELKESKMGLGDIGMDHAHVDGRVAERGRPDTLFRTTILSS